MLPTSLVMGDIQLALILATTDDIRESYFKPLGLGYIKSYIARSLPSAEVAVFEDINRLIRSAPDCAGVSASTENFSLALRYIEEIRKTINCPIILGGVHISLLPGSLPKGVIACIGEGEETVTELLSLLKEKKGFDESDLSKIKGIAFWNSRGELIQTPLRDLIRPLDNIPFPDRLALGIKGTVENLYIFTSRGCPYKCRFCVSRIHWNKYREFSAHYVIAEMEYLISHFHVKKITIFDDLFVVNRQRLREIADLFVSRGLNIDVFCAVRANLVDEELCDLLKKMRITQVTFGAESFSEPVLKALKDGSVTVEQNQNAINLLSGHGISVNCSIIFNSPEQSRDDIITTWKALFRNLQDKKLNKIGWGMLRPYPGSYYWDMALENNLVSVDMNWDKFRDFSNFHMNDHLSPEELNEVMDEWDTKCNLLSLTYRDAPQLYSTKAQIFIKKEMLFKKIQARMDKDEIDQYVTGEYEQFLSNSKQHKIVLLDGWYEPEADGYRWIRKNATFLIGSSIIKEGNFLNVEFYIPDVSNFRNKLIEIKFRLEKEEKGVTIESSGFHRLSVPLSLFLHIARADYLKGEITASEEFSPSEKSGSADTRQLSVLVTKFEIAQGSPDNPNNLIHLPSE
jgi:anaerobic magnesium-protoporphyrin IX monomethyl ester cyclase